MAQDGFKINQREYELRLDIPGRRASAVIGTVAIIETKTIHSGAKSKDILQHRSMYSPRQL
jgi:hypothetical protein